MARMRIAHRKNNIMLQRAPYSVEAGRRCRRPHTAKTMLVKHGIPRMAVASASSVRFDAKVASTSCSSWHCICHDASLPQPLQHASVTKVSRACQPPMRHKSRDCQKPLKPCLPAICRPICHATRERLHADVIFLVGCRTACVEAGRAP